jgi:hypothetical protein
LQSKRRKTGAPRQQQCLSFYNKHTHTSLALLSHSGAAKEFAQFYIGGK